MKLKEVIEKASAYAVDDAPSSNPNIKTPVKTFSDLTLMNFLHGKMLAPHRKNQLAYFALSRELPR